MLDRTRPDDELLELEQSRLAEEQTPLPLKADGGADWGSLDFDRWLSGIGERTRRAMRAALRAAAEKEG